MTGPARPRLAGREKSICSASPPLPAMDLETYCDRLATLAVETGANVQNDQIVVVTYSPGMEQLAHAVARTAYERGAKFVDPFVFDGQIKRIRIESAREETLDFVPDWWGRRMIGIGDTKSARISLAPTPDPGVLEGVDAQRASKDNLPFMKESIKLINDRSTNWTIVPFPTRGWAAKVHPDAPIDEAVERLTDQLAHILRLDEGDPSAAWKARGDQLVTIATRITERQFDSLRFRGPGTDLEVGLLPGSLWRAARLETAWGLEHYANLPSEEMFTTPDPQRVEGTVTATKPLDVAGTLVDGLKVRFENGQAVQIDADTGADVLRGRIQHDP